jgi:hypothetical protein
VSVLSIVILAVLVLLGLAVGLRALVWRLDAERRLLEELEAYEREAP